MSKKSKNSSKIDFFKMSESSNSEVKEQLNIQNYGEINTDFSIKNFGKNDKYVVKFSLFKKIIESIFEPFNILLLTIGLIELFTYLFATKDFSELFGFILVIAMLLIASTIGVTQDYKSYRINKSLFNSIDSEYRLLKYSDQFDLKTLLKNNILQNLLIEKESNLLVGQILYLTNGDLVPCDSRIIWSNNLQIDLSTLTGESNNVFRNESYVETKNIFELNNVLFSQTKIITGSCLAVIFNVGKNSFSNSLLESAFSKTIKSDYEKSISKIVKSILYIIAASFIVMFITLGVKGMLNSDSKAIVWIRAFVFSITAVVALVPEALPAIVAGNLQMGSKILSKENVIIKNPKIIQNLGSVNIFLTDKTGTLTIDELKLEDYVNCDFDADEDILNLAYINSYFQSSNWNNIDKSIQDFAKDKNFNLKDYTLIEEKEFSFNSRSSSVKVSKSNKIFEIIKGSPEEIIENCKYYISNGKSVKLTPAITNKIFKHISSKSLEGFKFLAISRIDEKEDKQIIQGFVIFIDKIKEDLKDAIEDIYNNDIDIKILTGDNVEITRAIAEKVKIKHTGSITGDEWSKLSRNELFSIAKEYSIFAKLNPYQKEEVIKCLKDDDHVVCYIGDGVNDSLALSASDVGIAVNKATNIAKQSADIIMTKKDLKSLDVAFILGRKTIYNAIKFIKLLIATNLGLLYTLVLSAFIFSFDVMNPSQLLVQNLIFDVSNVLFIYDNVDKESIRKPIKLSTKDIVKFGLLSGIVSTIISFVNFAIMYFGCKYSTGINNGDQFIINKFQTGFFIESFITHMLLIVVYRTEKVSIIKSNPNYKISIFITALVLLVIGSTYTNIFQNFLQFSVLDNIWYLYLFGVVVLTWMIAESYKAIYKKTFKRWI